MGIFYLKIRHIHKDVELIVLNSPKLKNFPNYKSLVFQLYPKLNYEVHQEFHEKFSKYSKIIVDIEEDEDVTLENLLYISK